jgi:hypothetical protein
MHLKRQIPIPNDWREEYYAQHHENKVVYSIASIPRPLEALFKGDFAHCGGCGHKLAKVKSADIEIKCPRTRCGALNIIKK